MTHDRTPYLRVAAPCEIGHAAEATADTDACGTVAAVRSWF
jgi:hypothetical protein